MSRRKLQMAADIVTRSNRANEALWFSVCYFRSDVVIRGRVVDDLPLEHLKGAGLQGCKSAGKWRNIVKSFAEAVGGNHVDDGLKVFGSSLAHVEDRLERYHSLARYGEQEAPPTKKKKDLELVGETMLTNNEHIENLVLPDSSELRCVSRANSMNNQLDCVKHILAGLDPERGTPVDRSAGEIKAEAGPYFWRILQVLYPRLAEAVKRLTNEEIASLESFGVALPELADDIHYMALVTRYIRGKTMIAASANECSALAEEVERDIERLPLIRRPWNW